MNSKLTHLAIRSDPGSDAASGSGILGRMCGLLALVGHAAGAITEETVDAVSGASHLMRHRGPDEPGTWADEQVVLGFNRLSIIDIAHSHQPLRWGPPGEPDRYVLVFNGEIYNSLE